MKIYIKNANLISMDETREKIEEDVDIVIEDDIIKEIGRNLSVEENCKVIRIHLYKCTRYARNDKYTCACSNEYF